MKLIVSGGVAEFNQSEKKNNIENISITDNVLCYIWFAQNPGTLFVQTFDYSMTYGQA